MTELYLTRLVLHIRCGATWTHCQCVTQEAHCGTPVGSLFHCRHCKTHCCNCPLKPLQPTLSGSQWTFHPFLWHLANRHTSTSSSVPLPSYMSRGQSTPLHPIWPEWLGWCLGISPAEDVGWARENVIHWLDQELNHTSHVRSYLSGPLMCYTPVSFSPPVYLKHVLFRLYLIVVYIPQHEFYLTYYLFCFLPFKKYFFQPFGFLWYRLAATFLKH